MFWDDEVQEAVADEDAPPPNNRDNDDAVWATAILALPGKTLARGAGRNS